MEFLFQAYDFQRYTTSHSTNLIVRMNSCAKNNEGDKAEIRKVVNWYAGI